ncbi:MAG: radical SAM protein [Candidatus Heimdallarchaeota archaeon]|nr:radical SAM protein [Candidatus Heimdallarchaeota archaeon]
MGVKYLELECKSILHRINSPRLPFNWGANPYRGCFHSCLYCYARYTHSYLELDPEHDFESTIFIKRNAPQILRKELSHPKWQKKVVNLGSVSDPYQPIERNEFITRNMLKEFKRYQNPLIIATKSDLVTRDKDIIADLSQNANVEVAISLSTLNDDLRKEIEPRASPTKKRLQAIEELRAKNITVGVLLMPVIPYLSDSFEELDELFKAISEVKASYIIPGILYLTGAAKKRFLEYIEIKHSEWNAIYQYYYKNRSPPKDYREKINKYFIELRKKYHMFKFEIKKSTKIFPQQQTLDFWVSEEKK